MRSRRKRVKVNSRMFAAYSAAGVAAMSGVPAADADIVHVSVNQALNDTDADPQARDAGAELQLLLGNNNSFQLGLLHNFTGGVSGSAQVGGEVLGNSPPGASVAGFRYSIYNYVQNVPYGQRISAQPFLAPASDGGDTIFPAMAYLNGYPNSGFLNAGEAFIGFRFNQNQHGWVRVDMDGAPLNNFTVVDYAFAGPGESIFAGQTVVPEPGSLAGLSLGAAGLLAWRRQRAAA